jgi:hypothetical protein
MKITDYTKKIRITCMKKNFQTYIPLIKKKQYVSK